MGDRVILHSDINCCYASIEHLHHPDLDLLTIGIVMDMWTEKGNDSAKYSTTITTGQEEFDRF